MKCLYANLSFALTSEEVFLFGPCPMKSKHRKYPYNMGIVPSFSLSRNRGEHKSLRTVPPKPASAGPAVAGKFWFGDQRQEPKVRASDGRAKLQFYFWKRD